MNQFSNRDFSVLIAVVVIGLALGVSLHRLSINSSGQGATRDDWLLAAPSDEARFRALQRQLRGFDQPMWEVGERFGRIHEALSVENYDLALYHWDKIDTTIRNGIVKRPGRAPNAEAMFLGQPFQGIRADFSARSPGRAWSGFNRARALCLSCHIAERVAFVNQQPLFELKGPGVSK